MEVGMQGGKKGFHVVDYVVFSLTIAISLGIGFFFSCRGQKTTGEYFMGDRNLRIVPVAISMIATFVSAIGLLGTPAEMYAYGTQFSMSIIANAIGCTLGAFTFLPLFYPLRLTSVFEYFELRFHSKLVRLLGTVVSLINMIFFNGVGMYAPSVALEAVSGFPVWMSMIICGLSTTIYTAIGGMKAVIWTDVFQSVIIFVGVLAVVIQGTIEVGGISEVWRLNQEWNRIEFFNFNPDPTERTTFWSVVVLMSILFTCITASQPAVQRYCALPNQRAAQISIFLNIPGFVLNGILCSLAGIVVFAYYAKQDCDPLTAKYITNPNQILPYFVMDVLGYPGVAGLFVACIYSGALSTVSSSLNAMAAITWEDMLKWKLGHLSQSKQALISKIIVAIYGVVSIAVGFSVQNMGGTFVQIVFSILGTTAGPIVGMLFIGGLVPRAGEYGVLIGGLIGFILSGWMAIGAIVTGIHTMPRPLPNRNCPNIMAMKNASMMAAMKAAANRSAMNYSPLDGASNTSLLVLGVNGSAEVGETIGMGMGFPSMPEVTGLNKMYAVSYLWYPAVGMITVLAIGSLLSYIPGLGQKKPVEKRYLFPCVRQCGGCCAQITENPEKIEAYGEEIEANGHVEHKLLGRYPEEDPYKPPIYTPQQEKLMTTDKVSTL